MLDRVMLYRARSSYAFSLWTQSTSASRANPSLSVIEAAMPTATITTKTVSNTDETVVEPDECAML